VFAHFLVQRSHFAKGFGGPILESGQKPLDRFSAKPGDVHIEVHGRSASAFLIQADHVLGNAKTPAELALTQATLSADATQTLSNFNPVYGAATHKQLLSVGLAQQAFCKNMSGTSSIPRLF
jgi:hypothetical protein